MYFNPVHVSLGNHHAYLLSDRGAGYRLRYNSTYALAQEPCSAAISNDLSPLLPTIQTYHEKGIVGERWWIHPFYTESH